MDFKWLPGKIGTPVIAQPLPPTPDAPLPLPIPGIIVPPGTDITLRTVHSTWQGGIASTMVTVLLPLIGIHLSVGAQAIVIAALTGLLALVRSWLSHRRQAKA